MIYYEKLSAVNEQFNGRFQKALEKLLKSGRYILGPSCAQFEDRWAHYCDPTDSHYCVSLNSGSDALRMILEACEFKPGSGVVLAANSYIATVLAVVNAGLRPVLVDIDMSYNIDVNKLVDIDKTDIVAIMPTHMYGGPSDLVKIKEWSGSDIKIIADCCQAHGTTINGINVVEYADANAFSFYPTKNLGCLGDGGAVVTDDEHLAHKLSKMRFYGVSGKADHESIGGGNSRLDEFQAEVLMIKLEQLGTMLEHKANLAKRYCDRLNIEYVIGHSYHIFAIRVADRSKFRDSLESDGVQTDIHYPILGYKQLSLGRDYIMADSIAKQIVSLPISFSHTLDNIDAVCDVILRGNYAVR